VVSAIVGDSGEVLADYADGSGIAFEVRTNVAIARG